MKNQLLPPDVAAYLQNAAIELAKETDFVPHSLSDLKTWMEGNRREIGRRAQDAMLRLREKLLSNAELRDTACGVLSREVYDRIPKTGAKQWNPRFVAYAKSQGLTPEAVLKRDGNMTGFICWRP